MSIRVALVGCGRIGRRHIQILLDSKFFRLVGICDVDPEKWKDFSGLRDTNFYLDMDKMLKSESPHLVVISTESGSHADHVVQASQYSVDILVEKPMALTLQDADRMLEACAKSGSRLMVVKQNRYNLPVMKARRLQAAGAFGKLHFGSVRVRWCREPDYYAQAPWRGTFSMDGGVIANQASHHVDLLRLFLGRPTKVHAVGRTFLAPIESEDTAVATVVFESGALGLVEATTTARPRDLEGSLSLLGDRGSLEIDGFAVNRLRHLNIGNFPSEEGIDLSSENPPDVYGYGHRRLYEEMELLYTEGEADLVFGEEARDTLSLIAAIYRSMETGETVDVASEKSHSRLGLK